LICEEKKKALHIIASSKLFALELFPPHTSIQQNLAQHLFHAFVQSFVVVSAEP